MGFLSHIAGTLGRNPSIFNGNWFDVSEWTYGLARKKNAVGYRK